MRISDWSSDVCSSDLESGNQLRSRRVDATASQQCAYRVDRRRNAVIARRRASVPSIVEECPHQSAAAIPLIVQPEFLGERPIPILLVVGAPIGGRHVVVGAIEHANLRSEERGVGTEGVSLCGSRWWPYY